MADPQSNARLRADAWAPTSGVIHVRTPLAADFTVVPNALAQRRGSAVTVGVAVYILSLPEGTRVSIAALCEHFTEGEILISRALKELEGAGYLERRRERGPGGHIRTRTYFHNAPGDVVRGDARDGDPDCAPDGAPDDDPADDPDGPPEPPKPPRPRKPRGEKPTPATTRVPAPSASPDPLPSSEADPQALAVLASLRRVDPRLLLSAQEAARLAPAVTQWLAAVSCRLRSPST